MKYFLILGVFFLAPSFSQAKHYSYYGHSAYQAKPISYASCSKKLRKAGYLARGKGSSTRNFHTINACVMNGGYV